MRVFFSVGLAMAWGLTVPVVCRHLSPTAEDFVVSVSPWFESRPSWDAICYDLEPFVLLLYALWLIIITIEAHHMPLFSGNAQDGCASWKNPRSMSTTRYLAAKY